VLASVYRQLALYLSLCCEARAAILSSLLGTGARFFSYYFFDLRRFLAFITVLYFVAFDARGIAGYFLIFVGAFTTPILVVRLRTCRRVFGSACARNGHFFFCYG
jgi:hypothetical protein